MPPEIIYQHQFDVIASSELNTFVGHDDPDVQQEDMLIMMTRSVLIASVDHFDLVCLPTLFTNVSPDF